MAEQALLATRTGSLTPGLKPIVSALGYTVTDTFSADSPEDNQYYLPPELVEKLADELTAAEHQYLAVDGFLHEGQLVDLADALGQVTIRDRRDVVFERLAGGGNETAEICLELRQRRIERRRAIRAQRSDAVSGPSGTSGTVSELDAECERLEKRRAEQQDKTRRQIDQSYGGVDAHVVVIGTITDPTSECWAELADSAGSDGPLRPATPATAVIDLASYELAVTETPGLIDSEAEWFVEAIPGTVAAVERADVVIAVGETDRDAVATLAPEFDGTILQSQRPNASGETETESRGEQLRDDMRAVLPTARLTVSLPTTDDAQSLVSWLYERATVEEIEYGNEISLVIEAPGPAVEAIRRRIEEAGGTSEQGS